jgi:hypothetical protein
MRFPLAVVALVLVACGSYATGRRAGRAADDGATPEGPLEGTAAESAATTGSTYEEPPPAPPDGASWGGWRYQGRRGDCFFVVERECFATLAAACEATSCKHGCDSRGAGPAIVTCK